MSERIGSWSMEILKMFGFKYQPIYLSYKKMIRAPTFIKTTKITLLIKHAFYQGVLISFYFQ